MPRWYRWPLCGNVGCTLAGLAVVIGQCSPDCEVTIALMIGCCLDSIVDIGKIFGGCSRVRTHDRLCHRLSDHTLHCIGPFRQLLYQLRKRRCRSRIRPPSPSPPSSHGGKLAAWRTKSKCSSKSTSKSSSPLGYLLFDRGGGKMEPGTKTSSPMVDEHLC